MAEATQEVRTTQEDQQYVIFRLGRETYGVPVDRVREVVASPVLTPVPRTRDFFSGIINLRGNVVPVISLVRRMELGEDVDPQDSRIVVVEWHEEVVGLQVDAVEAVQPISAAQVEAAAGIDTGADSFTRGVVRLTGNRVTLLMDLDRLLDQS